MKRLLLITTLSLLALLCLSDLPPGPVLRIALAQGQTTAKTTETVAPRPVSRAESDEAEALEVKRQQLMEKEAALKVKEEELKKLSASLDSRIKELNAARKAMESSLQTRKTQENERYKKILKVYKALKPEEAGKLMDKLDEFLVIEMLNQMDQKTAVKLIPYLNQPRVIKWTRDNLIAR